MPEQSHREPGPMLGELPGGNPEAFTHPSDAVLDYILDRFNNVYYIRPDPDTGMYQFFGTNIIDINASIIIEHGKIPENGIPSAKFDIAQDMLTDISLALDPTAEYEDDDEEFGPETAVGKYILKQEAYLESVGLDGFSQTIQQAVLKNLGNVISTLTLFNVGIRTILIRPEHFDVPPSRKKGNIMRAGRLNDDRVERTFRAMYNTLVRLEEVELTTKETSYYHKFVKANEKNQAVLDYNIVVGELQRLAQAGGKRAEAELKAAASAANKAAVLLLSDMFLSIAAMPTINHTEVMQRYAVRFLDRLAELEATQAPTVELDAAAAKHIISGDESGGGHVLEQIDPTTLEVLNDPETISRTINPKTGVRYAYVHNAAKNQTSIKTFFPPSWTPNQVLQFVSKPRQLLFSREHDDTIEQYVKTGNVVFIRRINKLTGRCFSAHPALNETAMAPLSKLQAEADANWKVRHPGKRRRAPKVR